MQAHPFVGISDVKSAIIGRCIFIYSVCPTNFVWKRNAFRNVRPHPTPQLSSHLLGMTTSLLYRVIVYIYFNVITLCIICVSVIYNRVWARTNVEWILRYWNVWLRDILTHTNSLFNSDECENKYSQELVLSSIYPLHFFNTITLKFDGWALQLPGSCYLSNHEQMTYFKRKIYRKM